MQQTTHLWIHQRCAQHVHLRSSLDPSKMRPTRPSQIISEYIKDAPNTSISEDSKNKKWKPYLNTRIFEVPFKTEKKEKTENVSKKNLLKTSLKSFKKRNKIFDIHIFFAPSLHPTNHARPYRGNYRACSVVRLTHKLPGAGTHVSGYSFKGAATLV